MPKRELQGPGRPAPFTHPDSKTAAPQANARAWDPIEIWRKRVLAATRAIDTPSRSSR